VGGLGVEAGDIHHVSAGRDLGIERIVAAGRLHVVLDNLPKPGVAEIGRRLGARRDAVDPARFGIAADIVTMGLAHAAGRAAAAHIAGAIGDLLVRGRDACLRIWPGLAEPDLFVEPDQYLGFQLVDQRLRQARLPRQRRYGNRVCLRSSAWVVDRRRTGRSTPAPCLCTGGKVDKQRQHSRRGLPPTPPRPSAIAQRRCCASGGSVQQTLLHGKGDRCCLLQGARSGRYGDCVNPRCSAWIGYRRRIGSSSTACKYGGAEDDKQPHQSKHALPPSASCWNAE